MNEALASLEMLMSEFFAPTTNNFRKREIESMLENFSSRQDSWKHCLIFLQKSHNQYVLMFTLTTLENIINRQWISLSDNEKTEIRLTLWNELMAKHELMPNFIRNKLASLMVAIARYDWPHLYPDFFENIVELIRCDGRRCVLGLVLAGAASEELGAARDSGVLLPSARRSQLERLMLKGTPQMLSVLSAILEKYAQKEGQSGPPPSPTSGIPQTSTLPDLLANAHDVHCTDKALNMEIVVKCLTTLQHLFSWLPLSSHVPPSLVTTVFYWGSIATQSQSMEAALAGLGGVCELLYRRYAPPSSAATALRLHHAALRLLRHLTHNQHHMAHAHHEYLNKLAEFLKLFVSLHFKRLEAEPEFDAIEFLSYLFQYTFQVPTCAIFVNCLDIWIQFIDILKPEDTAKYWEALHGLVNSVLNKILFQHNKIQLQHLDNEVCDDDGETEWHTFLKHCIECIARVAELAPLDVFTAVLERWQCLAGVHARAATRTAPGGGGGGAGAGGEAERLLAALLDLATLTRVLGRLAPALLSDLDNERGAAARAAGAGLVERVAAALAGAALTRPHRQAMPTQYVQVHAEMFACMGAWCCYASECGVSSHIMTSLFTAAEPFLLPHDSPEPSLLSHASAHLLLSMSKNMKFATDPIPLVGDLYNHAQRSLHYLEPKTAAVVREALLSLALSRSTGSNGAIVGGETARALLAAWTSALPVAGPAVALPPLTALLHAFATQSTPVKRILAEGMAGAAETSLRMLCEPAYAMAEQEITDYFLALFTAVLPQLGNFAYTAIDVFLEVAQRSGGSSSVERLVECVRLGVEAGGAGVRVSSVLALHHHAANAPQHDAPDLARAAHRLLASVLVHRWRYFFPHKCEGAEGARRLEELRGALAALGRALLQPDIDLLRTTLAALDHLHAKWKLYHKALGS
ncbi:exportin-6-A [Hyposmocoma kahamanoa]|uniref:exportin-6-A n=1 Tax=Hyposmocoma kahamanoa TaxID=1477025 RepID=UPI000E6D6A85|nr:exportin-6-A [Hyposmocoma kahamanoa]